MNDPGEGLSVSTKFAANNTLGGAGQHPGINFRGENGSNTPIKPTAYGVVVDITPDPRDDMGLNDELRAKWVDIGPRFGYSHQYPKGWPRLKAV